MKLPNAATVPVLLLALAAPAAAEPPALYKTVSSVHWVVRDLERVKAGWARLGLPAIGDGGELTLAPGPSREPGRARAALARFGAVDVVWLQPAGGDDPLSRFLKERGEGVFSVNYTAADAAARDAEVARLTGLGVRERRRAELTLAGARQSIVYLDTEAEGKYTAGIALGGAPAAKDQASVPFPFRLSQYALVVKSLEAVSAYWAKLGIPAMDITHGPLTDLRHRGQPGTFDQRLGWHRHGTVTWEWIQSLQGPTVYQEFLDRHGEGFHHLAFDVPDMDAAIAAWEARGLKVVQSGGWGEKGRPGSGRFAYVDSDTNGGVMIELLWSQR